MKSFTIKQIADELGAEAFGDLELEITGVNAPSRASINELALAMDPSYEESLNSSDAIAAIVKNSWLHTPITTNSFKTTKLES